jgi:tRNA-2-methylthio-N6-dimethylallyladenosine synthase
MKYFIHTFGCQQNLADSERIATAFEAKNMTPAKNLQEANYVVINTCMVRQSAENRVYGLIQNLIPVKKRRQHQKKVFKIILTGCITGLALRDKSGKYLKRLKEKLPWVDEFVLTEEAGFDITPLRQDKDSAWVPISNGCNNFCTYCVVPFSRGREISRPYEGIIAECKQLKKKGFKNITLLGQNVNSYGNDLLKIKNLKLTENLKLKIKNFKPIYVKHLGRLRIPTLFPYLLEEVAQMGFEKVDFLSSNPWDFSQELIGVIAKNKNISRTIHLPVQSGDNMVLKKMNRWYTSKQYLALISKIKDQISKIKFTTDIIVGFPKETEKQFQNTVDLCKKVGFEKAYVAMYSPRPMTTATKLFEDNVPHKVKKQRWLVLENLINKPHLKKH